MATYSTQTGGLLGAAVTYGAVTSSDDFVNNGAVRLHVKNAGGGSINVTVNSFNPCSFGFDHDLVIAVPAGSDRLIGPLDTSRFNDPATGKVGVAYSGITSVTAALLG